MNKQQKQTIRDLLVSKRAQQFAFLSALIQHPSENPPGEFTNIFDHLMVEFRKLGFSVQKFPEPDDDGPASPNSITNLVVRHEFGEGPTIALVTNVDTAAAGPDWTVDPFAGKIVDRKIYGRGAAGGKGALAAYVYALVVIRDQAESLAKDLPSGLAGAIELHITFDGEKGGDLGARGLLANKQVSPDLVIAPGTTHSLITSASGRLCLEVEINGRSAPASNPDQGIDTMDAAGKVISAIYDLRQDYAKITSDIEGIGSPTITVTGVHGGDNPRHIAARTTVNIDRRMIPEEDPAKVERALTTLIGTRVVEVKDMLCKIRRTYLAPAMVPEKGTDRLIAAFQRQAPDVLDGQLPVLGTARETDGRHYASAGIPTVLYGVGPSDPSRSTVACPDEVLELDDLRKSTDVLVFTLLDLLGAGDNNAAEDDQK